MSSELLAYLDGALWGTFRFTNGQVSFNYEPERSDATPLSLSMNPRRGRHGNKPASAFLWGLLPDNREALQNMAKAAGTSAGSLNGLLGHYGRDVAGALQLLPPDTPSTDAEAVDVRAGQSLTEGEVEGLLRQALEAYRQEQVLPGESFRFSVAGAQAKIALTQRDDGAWLPPGVGVATTHLLKPVMTAEQTWEDLDVVEQATMEAARRLGLNVAETALWTPSAGDLSVLVVKRYDREMRHNRVVRLHQEDLCQALAVQPGKKYQHRAGGPGVGAIARLFVSAAPAHRRQLGQAFFEALVFNVGVLGTDAHAKNYSVMLRGNAVSLAPLYDLISAAAHLGNLQGLDEAFFPMSIDGEYAFERMSLRGLVKEGVRLGLTRAESEATVERILGGVRGAMTAAAEGLGQPELAQRLDDGLSQLSLCTRVGA